MYRSAIAGLLVFLLAVFAGARIAAAQEMAPSISAGYEYHRDRLHYGFENPSNVDTSFLVPHRFDQNYVADNQWLVVAAKYRLFGDLMETEVGLTPHRTAFGSDLDTFFDPGNDVVVSGTRSDVTMHSLRVAQWSDATLWGLPWRVGYVYRRDTAEFHATERLVTHTNPPSSAAIPIHTHETTISEVHEIPIGVSKPISPSPRWLVVMGADVAPIVIAKDTTLLPEKYPGQPIGFSAKVASLSARLDVTWRARWPITASLHYGRTWSYRASNQFDRDTLMAGIGVGLMTRE